VPGQAAQQSMALDCDPPVEKIGCHTTEPSRGRRREAAAMSASTASDSDWV